jgi:hypothetical protein
MSKRNSATYAVEVRRGDHLARVIDGGLGGLPDKRRAARAFYYWLVDNGLVARAEAAVLASRLEAEGEVASIDLRTQTVAAKLVVR